MVAKPASQISSKRSPLRRIVASSSMTPRVSLMEVAKISAPSRTLYRRAAKRKTSKIDFTQFGSKVFSVHFILGLIPFGQAVFRSAHIWRKFARSW